MVGFYPISTFFLKRPKVVSGAFISYKIYLSIDIKSFVHISGKLRDGRIVAIKRLYEHNCRRMEQFMNEVQILSRLRHPNLVALYGCTSRHSRELLLVYEFIPNGTVADHLHGCRADEKALTWRRRLTIAIEAAEALAYLHAVDPPIIHRDVKTSNMLVDVGYHVKVMHVSFIFLFSKALFSDKDKFGITLSPTYPSPG